ncbi:acyl-ACP desaturase [Solihabitans fulvus]|uniref:Acyl-ACP desaturase n=1 Tax=Solihabitans fulvus TaxID=1892852 RepID=A0A5B2WQU0_9PSEU|nr:acyl-ACP desaturase [Solihabitans fulvus]KAA2252819.1 acyl-ACP desaturase [Solihabitans fulvus]
MAGAARSPEPIGGPLLTAAELDPAVRTFLRVAAHGGRWDVDTEFDWGTADADRLTEGERSAVEFVTVIEDHLPGYFAMYDRHFPVDDSVDLPTFEHNRELYHFSVRWAQEEDTHALALARYQLAAGMAEPDTLRGALAVEGHKRFDLPYPHAVQFFTYALVQEKATQLYYQHLRRAVGDPLLADVLGRLSRDEARHFAFFADVVQLYLRRHGEAMVEPIRAVVADFRMPLADTIKGYWRWALRIADVARYDHTEAYEHLIKVVNRAVDAPSDRVDELTAFVAACRSLTEA